MKNHRAETELLLMKQQAGSSVFSQNPKLQKDVLCSWLDWVVTFFQFTILYFEKEMGNIPASDWSSHVGSMVPGLVGLGAYIVLGIWLLRTKSLTVARYIIAFAGVTFLYFVARDLLSFNPIGLLIDGFILWRIYELYESV
jgi:hypothetical protein